MPKDKTILIIEDEYFIQDMYRLYFSKAGFKVITASDGQEGLDKVRNNQIDLILLDIMLPKINGIEVLKELKKDQKTNKIPIFLLTNLGQESIIKEAYKIGAEGYMIKANFLPEDIIKKVNDYFEDHKTPDN